MPKPERQHGGRRQGAGRPRIYVHRAHPTSVMIELETLVRLNHKIGRLKISRTAAIKQAIEQWLLDT